LRAGLVARATDWKRDSLWRGRAKVAPERPALLRWPMERPRDWTSRVNMPLGPADEKAGKRGSRSGHSIGSAFWR